MIFNIKIPGQQEEIQGENRKHHQYDNNRLDQNPDAGVSAPPAFVANYPGVVDGLLHREPQPGVGAHEARDEVFGLLADVRPEVLMELIFPLHDLTEQFGLGIVCLVFEERRIAAQHDVGDNATRPQILGSTRLCLGDHLKYYTGCDLVLLMTEERERGYLRCEVSGSATYWRLLVEFLLILRQSKVHHDNLRILCIVIE